MALLESISRLGEKVLARSTVVTNYMFLNFI